MSEIIQQLHHITAIVGAPNQVLKFYRDILGLRLVKKTLNYDDPYTYHLYFGNNEADAGTIITFFPWENNRIGQLGDGQVATTSFAIPAGSLDFWANRFDTKGIRFARGSRFGNETLLVKDFHNLNIELVEKDWGKENTYTVDDITPETAIQGFAGAILYSHRPDHTVELFDQVFGWHKVDEDDQYIRLQAPGDHKEWLDIRKTADTFGKMEIGTVHHIAFEVADENALNYWLEIAHQRGYHTSEIKDRDYFKSLYFRERGGILIELATAEPGFTLNESVEDLGSQLFYPEKHKDVIDQVKAKLTPLDF
jgi:glyoxalase family protein